MFECLNKGTKRLGRVAKEFFTGLKRFRLTKKLFRGAP